MSLAIDPQELHTPAGHPGTPPAAPGTTCSPLRRFTLAEYERLHQANFFHSERTELIRGEIRSMLAAGPAHMFATAELRDIVTLQLPKQAFGVYDQDAVRMGQSCPEPDLFVTQKPRREYTQRAPRAEDVLLVIEVSDTTLAIDRSEKLALYASASIPSYWIVNLVERQIERYSVPALEQGLAHYGKCEVVGEKQTLTWSSGAARLSFAVSDLLVPIEQAG